MTTDSKTNSLGLCMLHGVHKEATCLRCEEKIKDEAIHTEKVSGVGRKIERPAQAKTNDTVEKSEFEKNCDTAQKLCDHFQAQANPDTDESAREAWINTSLTKDPCCVASARAAWDARDEEVKRLHANIETYIRLVDHDTKAIEQAQAENRQLSGEVRHLKYDNERIKIFNDAKLEENKRLRDALEAFQEGINPENMTERQREAMKYVSLKDANAKA